MALKDNLKRIREERHLSQSGLAKSAGVSQQLISRLEGGLDLTTKRLPEIARALGVSAYEIDENFSSDDAPAVVNAPLLSWVSAGQLETADAIMVDSEADRRSATGLDPKGKWIALKVTGDSMDRISPPDSIVFVNLKDRRLVPNGCYVIQDADGGSTYKRYRPGRWEAVSTNPKHKPYILKGDRAPVVIGRVKRTVLDL